MNHVFTKNQAARSTAGGERLARFARNGMLAVALACTAAGALAAGQDRTPRREELQQQAMRERFDARAQPPRYDDRYEQRAFEIREEARLRQEQAMREQPLREEGRRMTPDARSDLRRQINEANRDLYPTARRR